MIESKYQSKIQLFEILKLELMSAKLLAKNNSRPIFVYTFIKKRNKGFFK